MRYLTKSRFKLAVECPTKLFYSGKRDEYRDQMTENDFLAMLAEGGYQVGELAKRLYPDGIEIGERDHAQSIASTLEYLQLDKVVLFEPAIRVGDFFIRIDILVKNGDRFELIEVKAKSFDSRNPGVEGARGDINAKMLPYIQDAAFQTWVLRQAVPHAHISTFLMMPDKAKRAPVDGVNQMFKIVGPSRVEVRPIAGLDMQALARDLLVKICVDRYVDRVLNSPLDYPGGSGRIGEVALAWAEAYRRDQRITPVIGVHCGKCQYIADVGGDLKSGFHECWKAVTGWTDANFPPTTVLDLWNYHKKQMLIDRGIHKLSQVQREDFKDFEEIPGEDGLSHVQRQWLQIGGIPPNYDYGGFYFDSALFVREMGQWRFPLHMIDFETSSVALPFYHGMRPYEALAFQFSHHVIDADGRVRHAGQFLCAEPGEFPDYVFARALKEQLESDVGSVFMWSHHENTILNSIVRQLEDDPSPPEDAEELIAFLTRLIKGGDRAMVDLRVLAQRAFYHPDTHGSCSIKKVLPAVIKVSRMLRETYGGPVYGAPGGIPSLNFSRTEGFTWLEMTPDGGGSDPYAKLKQYALDLIPDNEASPAERASIIAEGGAAATAYARLQFEDMGLANRERIKSALLRYCELDTLAMVMVVQAWQAWADMQ